MPTYIRRPHDDLLRAPSWTRQCLRADSWLFAAGPRTGKTRATYKAVADRLADWQLDYPLNVVALKERLDAGIPARTVLWLRQYVEADGGAAELGRLADLLQGEGHLLVTSMWPEQWTAYTAAARAGPGPADPAGTTGRLLERLPDLTDIPLPGSILPAAGSLASRIGSLTMNQ